MSEILVREAKIEDSSEIVELLKTTLGERDIKKTIPYWYWKHYENPFGTSKILLAIADSKIVGVRAFMQWSWENNQTSVASVRAVDSVTHKSFQGKGIFTKLNKEALILCRNEGIKLVFNTPNRISLKTYLKLGWIENGKLPIKLKLGLCIPNYYNDNKIDEFYLNYPVQRFLEYNNDFLFSKNLNIYFETKVTKEYLIWRYINCPSMKYGFTGEEGKVYLFFRLKQIGNYIELRICDIISNNAPNDIQLVKRLIIDLNNKIRPLIISFAPSSNKFLSKLEWIKIKLGPVTTIRQLDSFNINDFTKFSNWRPSLGSMELF
jgi:GNAT superfamily N-acetyltransferase